MLREKAAESARLKLEDTWYDVDQYKQKHPGFKVNYFTNHENQKGVTIYSDKGIVGYVESNSLTSSPSRKHPQSKNWVGKKLKDIIPIILRAGFAEDKETD